jgi:hypothetical protein
MSRAQVSFVILIAAALLLLTAKHTWSRPLRRPRSAPPTGQACTAQVSGEAGVCLAAAQRSPTAAARLVPGWAARLVPVAHAATCTTMPTVEPPPHGPADLRRRRGALQLLCRRPAGGAGLQAARSSAARASSGLPLPCSGCCACFACRQAARPGRRQRLGASHPGRAQLQETPAQPRGPQATRPRAEHTQLPTHEPRLAHASSSATARASDPGPPAILRDKCSSSVAPRPRRDADPRALLQACSSELPPPPQSALCDRGGPHQLSHYINHHHGGPGQLRPPLQGGVVPWRSAEIPAGNGGVPGERRRRAALPREPCKGRPRELAIPAPGDISWDAAGGPAPPRSPRAASPSARPPQILLVGDSGVGKSCLLMRFTADKFEDSTTSTIGGAGSGSRGLRTLPQPRPDRALAPGMCAASRRRPAGRGGGGRGALALPTPPARRAPRCRRRLPRQVHQHRRQAREAHSVGHRWAGALPHPHQQLLPRRAGHHLWWACWLPAALWQRLRDARGARAGGPAAAGGEDAAAGAPCATPPSLALGQRPAFAPPRAPARPPSLPHHPPARARPPARPRPQCTTSRGARPLRTWSASG